SGLGSVSPGQGPTTTYSAPPNSGTTATIVATSVADPTKTRTVTITVNAPPPPPPPPPPPGKLRARAVPIQDNIATEVIAPIHSPAASTGAKDASTPGQPRTFLRPTKRAPSDVPPEPPQKKKK